MKASFRTANGRIEFEIEAANAKTLFAELASVQEVFDAEHKCGMCQSDDLRFRVREVEKGEYYELYCAACRAQFGFGQSKDKVSLFPKRREDGKNLPNGGWSRWEPNGAKAEERPADPYAETRTGPRILPETQAIFDKIAARLECAPPVTLVGMLNIMNEYLVRAHGPKQGREAFAVIQTRYERENPQGIRDPLVIERLLTDLWRAGKKAA